LGDELGLVERFFNAFGNGDWRTMARCYHDKASFTDPIFPDLRGEQIVYYWHQWFKENEGIKLNYSQLFADERKAQVQWNVRYTYQGRAVKHDATSTLAIWDDQIVRHVDEFALGGYLRQREGLLTGLLSGIPLVHQRVQRSARSRLDKHAGTIAG
jgi:hypothetical protein